MALARRAKGHMLNREDRDGIAMKAGALAIGLIMMLGACGQNQATQEAPPAELKIFDVKEEAADAAMGAAEAPGSPVPTATPRIAYKYALGYRVDAADITDIQAKHMALCEKATPTKCRVKGLERVVNDGDFITASLNLVVDAGLAKQFQADLDKAVTSEGGENTSRTISAEDLSKQMVDTAARIKAKQALADRLLALLQNRSGKVGELVEAERAFADAQEELEAARTWMAEMQARVAMSDIDISYQSAAPSGSGLWRPIREAFGEVGQMLGDSVATLLRLVIVILPWALALLGLVWLIRRRGWMTGWRWRFWRKPPVHTVE
jgi:hypothetical protein